MRATNRVLLLLACAVVLLGSAAAASWCGGEGCYQVLGVKESADAKEIRTAYYKFSRELHPDKNKAPDAQKKFQRVAKAYEVLSDERSRKRYDYALAHPEEDIQEEPYGIWKYWRTDVRAVILGFFLVLSTIQYFGKKAAYDTAVKRIKAMPRYANRRAQLIADWEAAQQREASKSNGKGILVKSSSGAALSKAGSAGGGKATKRTTKSKSKGPILPPEVEADIDAQLANELSVGVPPPSWKATVGYQAVVAPWLLAKWLYWQGHWQYAYQLRHQEFTPEDQEYLTCKTLKWPKQLWNSLPEEQCEEYISLRLWEPENLKNFYREVKRGKRRLPKVVSLENSGYDADDDAWANIGDD